MRCAETPAPRPARRRLEVATGAGVALAALGACAQPARPGPRLEDFSPVPEAPAGTRVSAGEAARAAVARMGRGTNFGNMLDAPREGDWGLRVEDRFIDLVGESGFTRSVRLPVRWSNHASADAAATIDPVFVGEFGAYRRAPQPARLRHLRLKREAMKRLDLPWFYWELASGFGVYGPEAGRLREPPREALFGG